MVLVYTTRFHYFELINGGGDNDDDDILVRLYTNILLAIVEMKCVTNTTCNVNCLKYSVLTIFPFYIV